MNPAESLEPAPPVSPPTSPHGAPHPPKRLARETSPYLLQHAHNPVDWYPWGPEALDRARAEDKPILLSIGYAACHWCHVMERECFESESIAALMNRDFVCIKVDREERPDLDDLYMAATVALTGAGGWPMTVFLTPSLEPFFAGTYFPPQDRYGRPGFPSLLARIVQLWHSERGALDQQAATLTAQVRARTTPDAPATVGASLLERAVAQLQRRFEPSFGGFSEAPKFPPSAALSLLARVSARTGDEATRRMVTVTLDGMARGGMRDHLGGGFARYSTDQRWLVPHFEKMLYDNAQLARAYLEGYQLTGSAEYRRVAQETLEYVRREMQSPEGAYFSATDADSEGVEGKFFVWTPEQVEAELIDADARAFCAYYDVTPEGNWEGLSVLHTPQTLASVAQQLGVAPEALERSLERSRGQLYAARARRTPPLLDDKLLASWNGLMLGAMAEGYRVLRDSAYLESATRAAADVLARLRLDDGSLARTARAGRAQHRAHLEDYACLADGLLDLYEAGGDPRWLGAADALCRALLERFADPDGGPFFQTSHDHETLLHRAREGHDGALPNPNSVAARALARLSVHLGRDDLREAAARALRGYGEPMQRMPSLFATALGVVDWLTCGPVELVFAGTPDDPHAAALSSEVARHFLPNRSIAFAPIERAEEGASALAAGRSALGGLPTLFVCRRGACLAPITAPEAVAAALEDARAASERERAPGL